MHIGRSVEECERVRVFFGSPSEILFAIFEASSWTHTVILSPVHGVAWCVLFECRAIVLCSLVSHVIYVVLALVAQMQIPLIF